MVYAALNRCRYATFSSPSLDNFVFKLCYRWTTMLLVVFSFVVTCRLVLGDSFYCSFRKEYFSESFTNSKCYSESTYTVSQKSVFDPAVENFRRNQSYYPWVNLFFLVQAFNFYLPHLLWKSYEGGYVYKLTAGVQKYFDKKETRELELCYLAKYVLINQGKHKIYTSLYILFEICNFSISVAQNLWLVHFFEVTGVPNSLLPVSLETWLDFRQLYFPPTGMCKLEKLGASGSAMFITTTCELPLNHLFMKMFVFLRAWYIFITILTGMVLFYRITFLVPSFRMISAKIFANLAEPSVLKLLTNKMSYSDWFFLSRMKKSMSDVDFAKLLNKIIITSQGMDGHEGVDKPTIYEESLKDFERSDAISPL